MAINQFNTKFISSYFQLLVLNLVPGIVSDSNTREVSREVVRTQLVSQPHLRYGIPGNDTILSVTGCGRKGSQTRHMKRNSSRCSHHQSCQYAPLSRHAVESYSRPYYPLVTSHTGRKLAEQHLRGNVTTVLVTLRHRTSIFCGPRKTTSALSSSILLVKGSVLLVNGSVCASPDVACRTKSHQIPLT